MNTNVLLIILKMEIEEIKILLDLNIILTTKIDVKSGINSFDDTSERRKFCGNWKK